MSQQEDGQTRSRDVIISFDGWQKLSAALLLSGIGLFVYSFQELRKVNARADSYLATLNEKKIENLSFQRETDTAEALATINERSYNRVQILKDVDTGRDATVSQDIIDEWRKEITVRRTELQRDLGSLQQFNNNQYPHSSNLAKSLASSLKSEDHLWLALQEFLTTQANSDATATQKERAFQSYVDGLLAQIYAISTHEGTNKAALDAIKQLREEKDAEYARMLADVRGAKATFITHTALFVVSVMLIVLFCCGVAGVRIPKKEKSRIIIASK